MLQRASDQTAVARTFIQRVTVARTGESCWTIVQDMEYLLMRPLGRSPYRHTNLNMSLWSAAGSPRPAVVLVL